MKKVLIQINPWHDNLGRFASRYGRGAVKATFTVYSPKAKSGPSTEKIRKELESVNSEISKLKGSTHYKKEPEFWAAHLGSLEKKRDKLAGQLKETTSAPTKPAQKPEPKPKPSPKVEPKQAVKPAPKPEPKPPEVTPKPPRAKQVGYQERKPLEGSTIKDAPTGYVSHPDDVKKLLITKGPQSESLATDLAHAVAKVVPPDILKQCGEVEVSGRANQGRGAYHIKYNALFENPNRPSLQTGVSQIGPPKVSFGDPDMAVHEFGHHIEHSLGLSKIMVDHAESYARQGKRFPTNYFGKIYRGEEGKSSEVLSMGLEHYFKDKKLFQTQDPETFALIENVLSGKVKGSR